MSYSVDEFHTVHDEVKKLLSEVHQLDRLWICRPKTKALDRIFTIRTLLLRTCVYLEGCNGSIQNDVRMLMIAMQSIEKLTKLPYIEQCVRYPRKVDDPSLTLKHAKARNKELCINIRRVANQLALLGSKLCGILKATEEKEEPKQ